MANLTLIYLHGFQSSGLAFKSQLLSRYVNQQQLPIEVISPDLPDTPDLALGFIGELILKQADKPVVLMGSSLGGFYANIFCERAGVPAVMINPAIRPHELIKNYLGNNVNPNTHKTYELTPSDLHTLKNSYHDRISLDRKRLILLEMGDEVLDASDAIQYYHGCQMEILQGGSHHFDHFEPLLPLVTDWVQKQV
ncbi:MAG: alpha/beta fold hydrolase [Cellvibrionales bacterium]|nr:alpha/beta fold hydrolase [Cellvibrionales bacterium]